MSKQKQTIACELASVTAETYPRNSTRWQRDMAAALCGIRNDNGYDGDEVLGWIESWGTADEASRPMPLNS